MGDYFIHALRPVQTMSVAGIDFGNLNCVLAVARKRGIDIIANEASSRETASLVGFRDDQRSLGELANAQLTSNLNNTASNFKRLLGQSPSTKEAQAEMEQVYCPTTELDGRPAFSVDYKGDQVFTPEQITAMLFTQLRKTIEGDSDNKIKLQEAVISVPPYFTYSQRRALKDAMDISGVPAVQLLSEPLAVAIPWGMYKKDFPEDGSALNVMFVNFGEASLWAAVLSVSSKQLSVLSVASDPFLGGRDFDNVLCQHFVEVFKEEYKMDVSTNKRAMLRLKTQCERLKKVLTTNPEAPLYVESIMNEVDAKGFIKREQFEQLSAPLLERIDKVIQEALDGAKLDKPLDVVEIVGGSSYVASFQERLKAVTGKELSHTMNKSEAVARGCALQCAIISPQFHINKVATFRDYNPYTIKLTWTETAEEGAGVTKSAVLFEKGCALNAAKKITFSKHNRIEIRADYADEKEFSFTMSDLNIGHFVVEPFTPTVEGTKPPVIKVTFKLDASGLFFMQHAQAIETYTETIKTKVPKKADKEGDAPMKEGEAKDAEMEEVEEQKERQKTTNLNVQAKYISGYSAEQITALHQQEIGMQLADELIIATLDAKNALESFSYDTQGKLQYDFSDWTPFASEEEKSKLLSAVDDNLAWLYGEGENADKVQFQNKLTELQLLSAPLELRKNESETRAPALEKLKQTLQTYKDLLSSSEEQYAHITSEQKQPLQDKIAETEEWTTKMQEKQDALPANVDPVLLTSEIATSKRPATCGRQGQIHTQARPSQGRGEEGRQD